MWTHRTSLIFVTAYILADFSRSSLVRKPLNRQEVILPAWELVIFVVLIIIGTAM